jgi:hypothetical protein
VLLIEFCSLHAGLDRKKISWFNATKASDWQNRQPQYSSCSNITVSNIDNSNILILLMLIKLIIPTFQRLETVAMLQFSFDTAK